MIRRTVILLAKVIVEDLGECRGVAADPELDSAVLCLLLKNFGVLMNEGQPRSVAIGNKNFFFNPLVGELVFDRDQELLDPFSRGGGHKKTAAALKRALL